MTYDNYNFTNKTIFKKCFQHKMKTFPSRIAPKNKHLFTKLNYNRTKCYMRMFIYEFLISRKDETEYFTLEEFSAKRGINLNKTETANMLKNMLTELSKELISLNWNCTISYGGTGLFIYTDNKPANCIDNQTFEDI